MNTKSKILELAKSSFSNQSIAISKLSEQIDDDFVQVVELLLNQNKRLIITGIGKSAIIGMKITATLNSTGTRSMFMHAADAIHGDLGMIGDEDVVLCISKSGNTPWVIVIRLYILWSGKRA